MSYTITLTDGTIFAVIPDGTINTSSSMVLVGKNYAGYGQFLDTNYIHLLENSSNSTAPGAPLTGQLWWDSGNGIMKAYNGTTWKTIGSATASASAPVSNVTGDLWYDTTNQQLNVYNGTSFILVGPSYSNVTGTTGAIVSTITDNSAQSHVVVEMYTKGNIVGIFNQDTAFTPGSSVPGNWGTQQVLPGLTLNSSIGGVVQTFNGNATGANSLVYSGTAYTANQFMRSDTNTSTTGTLSVLTNNGLFAGSNSDFKVTVAGTAVTVANQTANGNLQLGVNVSGSPTTVMNILGSTGQVTLPSSAGVSATGNIAGGNISTAGIITVNSGGAATAIVNGGSNAVGNIGSASSYFNRVFATSTTALYADVAERFAADEVLEAGTVVELGGVKEITRSKQALSENVFGVISTRAAYLMNGGAGEDDTHPPVAMTGRVPVQVLGAVRKGDRLVSAGNGIARAAAAGEATAFNTIGRALEDKLDTAQGIVEAIVTIK